MEYVGPPQRQPFNKDPPTVLQTAERMIKRSQSNEMPIFLWAGCGACSEPEHDLALVL